MLHSISANKQNWGKTSFCSFYLFIFVCFCSGPKTNLTYSSLGALCPQQWVHYCHPRVRKVLIVFLVSLATQVIAGCEERLIMQGWDSVLGLQLHLPCLDPGVFFSAWAVSQKETGLGLPVVTADSLDRPLSAISLPGMPYRKSRTRTFLACLPRAQKFRVTQRRRVTLTCVAAPGFRSCHLEGKTSVEAKARWMKPWQKAKPSLCLWIPAIFILFLSRDFFFFWQSLNASLPGSACEVLLPLLFLCNLYYPFSVYLSRKQSIQKT